MLLSKYTIRPALFYSCQSGQAKLSLPLLCLLQQQSLHFQFMIVLNPEQFSSGFTKGFLGQRDRKDTFLVLKGRCMRSLVMTIITIQQIFILDFVAPPL